MPSSESMTPPYINHFHSHHSISPRPNQNRENLLAISQPNTEYESTANANSMPDINMGEVPGAPTASPREFITLKRPSKQPRPETPQEAIQPPPIPENWQLPRHPNQDTPPESPTHESPQSHISAAVASRTAQIKTTGEQVLELVSDQSEDHQLGREEPTGSCFPGQGLLVLNFSKNLAIEHPVKEIEKPQPHSLKQNSYAEAARTSPSAPKANPRPTRDRNQRNHLVSSSAFPESPPGQPTRHYGHTHEAFGQDLFFSHKRDPTGALWPSNLAKGWPGPAPPLCDSGAPLTVSLFTGKDQPTIMPRDFSLFVRRTSPTVGI